MARRPPFVFVDLVAMTVKQQPEGVHVTTRRRAAAWFRSRPTVLAPADTDAAYGVARLTTTWRP